MIYNTVLYSTIYNVSSGLSPILLFLFSKVKAIKVDHPADAHGFLVKDKKHSVVYSGDTKPCERLIQEGLSCCLIFLCNASRGNHDTDLTLKRYF